MTSDDPRRKKLKLRAWRRGFREADLILGPFADRYVDGFDAGELDWFEALLNEADQEVYDWILERSQAPAPFDGPLMIRLKAFRDEAYKSSGEAPRGG